MIMRGIALALLCLLGGAFIGLKAAGDNKGGKQKRTLYSIQILLMGILVCLIVMVWKGA